MISAYFVFIVMDNKEMLKQRYFVSNKFIQFFFLIKIYHLGLQTNDRYHIGQLISFQLLETYEQLIQFPSQIFLTSLTILLTARLRLTQERIRNLTLEEDNGLCIQLFLNQKSFLSFLIRSCTCLISII
jgi:hypothetical protein